MNTSPKLQRAGRAFLLRLVYENGPEEAASVLRNLADEIEGLALGRTETPQATREGVPVHRGRALDRAEAAAR